jgi:hypothetical protein
MSEQMTEREAALAARVKELEDAQAKSAATTVEGGALESVWRRVADIVPSSLVAACLAVLVAHYGFGYYLQSQVTAAETELQQAKSDVEIAKAKTANQPVDGVPMQLATLKAQVEKTRAEAAAAKASATALAAQFNGESAALQKAKAELDNLQNQARLAQAKADAEGAKFGLATLEERAVKAKLGKQQLAASAAKGIAAYNRAYDFQNDALNMARPTRAQVAAECSDNPYAEMIGCPSQFLPRNSVQSDNSRVATAPSEDNGNFWKVPNSCAPAWQYFRGKAAHGAFAVTKYLKGGGCGWSWSPTRPIEIMRREAIATCTKYASDCKIISEK